MNHSGQYVESAELVGERNSRDLRAVVSGKQRHVWGRHGTRREADLLRDIPDDCLPVLIGAGLGNALAGLIETGRPVAVADLETPLLDAADIAHRFGDSVFFAEGDGLDSLLESLKSWREQHGNKPFHPVALPFHLRLRNGLYAQLASALTAANSVDFWTAARYPKFRSESPRVLLLQADYFLSQEIRTAFDRMAVSYRTLSVQKHGRGSSEFVKSLLETVLDFKPDFVLTINHFGLDRDGRFTELLDRLELPLASWFVDSPHLILFDYPDLASERTVIFSYDADTLAPMRSRGFENVHWLPLGTDHNRFRPGQAGREQWRADISFVGNSMENSVRKFLDESRVPHELLANWQGLAAEFAASPHHLAAGYLAEAHPDLWDMLQAVQDTQSRLAYESLITFEATRQYRQECVRQTLKFTPLVAGDAEWSQVLGDSNWRRAGHLDYYRDLPGFYPSAAINLNCTSMQMKGAVNQRVFDIPACGGFVLTDSRKQMAELFDPETEFIAYTSPDAIAPLAHELLRNEKKRIKVAESARRRILSEHTYEHRIKSLFAIMRESFV